MDMPVNVPPGLSPTMDMPVNVPIDNPNADTEWNDILRKHGVIPEKPPSPTPMIEEAILEARRLAHENRLEGKDLDELDELEDEEDEEFLESYRRKRMAEMSQLSTKSVHGSVYPLQKPDYSREVTEASKSYFVFVLMASSRASNYESNLAVQLFREAAGKYPDIKFCQIRADMAVEGYPERNCPTILIYKDTEIKKQVVTLREWGGVEKASMRDVEDLLISVKAIQPNDMRLKRRDEDDEDAADRSKSIKTSNRGKTDDDDDDWD